MFSVEFEGLKELLDQLRKYPDKVLQALESALYVEGEQTISEAKPLVPVDEGVLRASGFVKLPEVNGDDVMVEIGFGGPAGTGNHDNETNLPAKKNKTGDVGYAVIVHEDLTAFHTVGQSKYLEAPLNKRRDGYSKRIGQRIVNRVNKLK